MKRLLALLVVISLQAVESAKVLIITHSHCRPDFIELQVKTFNAFLKESYEFVVFNDAPEATLKNAIEQTCARLNVRCIRVPQELHSRQGDPGARHIHGIQYSLNTVGFDHDGTVFIIDSDMFLIRPFSIKDYMEDYNFVAQRQERPGYGTPKVVYIAPLLVFMDMKTLPNKRTMNFEGGVINGEPCDVGGHIYYYFRDNPCLKIKFSPAACMDEVAHDSNRLKQLDEVTQRFLMTLNQQFDSRDPHRMQFHGDNNFIHYVAGSNWNNRSKAYHDKKTRVLHEFIDEMIEHHNMGHK